MLNPAASARRAIPSLDRLLKLEAVETLVARHGRPLVTETAREELARLRAVLARDGAEFDETAFVRACAERLEQAAKPSLKPVFNLTGTVLHTNLGRAAMPEEVANVVVFMASDRASWVCGETVNVDGGRLYRENWF